MKFKVKATVKLDAQLNSEHLKQVLQPENSIIKDNEISTYTQDNHVITDIEGYFSIRTLLRTVDDILQTVTLSANVASSTGKD